MQELRAPIFALRAFNVETALIGEHARSEMLVLMRCQVCVSLCARAVTSGSNLWRYLHQQPAGSSRSCLKLCYDGF